MKNCITALRQQLPPEYRFRYVVFDWNPSDLHAEGLTSAEYEQIGHLINDCEFYDDNDNHCALIVEWDPDKHAFQISANLF